MYKALYYLAMAYKLKTVINSDDDNRYQFTKKWATVFMLL